METLDSCMTHVAFELGLIRVMQEYMVNDTSEYICVLQYSTVQTLRYAHV